MSMIKPSIQKHAFIILALFFALLFSAVAKAETSGSPASDSQKINEQLNTIKQSTLNTNNNYDALTEILHHINLLKPQINACIKSTNTQLIKIDHLLQEIDLSKGLSNDTQPYQYLIKEKQAALTEMNYCQFFNFRLEEIQDATIHQINNVNKSVLLEKDPNWRVFSPNVLVNIPLNLDIIYQHSGLKQLNRTHMLYLALIFISSLTLTVLIRHHYISCLLPMLLICSYLNVIFMHTSPTPILVLMMNALTIYMVTLIAVKRGLAYTRQGNHWPKANTTFQSIIVLGTALTVLSMEFILYKDIPISLKYFDYLPLTYALVISRLILTFLTEQNTWLTEHLATTIKKRVFIIATVALIGYAASTLLNTQPISPQLLSILDAFNITLLNIAYVCLIMPFINHIIPQHYHKAAHFMLTIFCLLGIIAAWNGYHHFAIRLIPNLIITCVMIVIVVDANRFVNKVYVELSDPSRAWSQKLRYILGIKTEQKLIELYIIRLFWSIPLLFLGVFCVMEVWGTTRYQIFSIITVLHQGVVVSGITYRGSVILRGIMFFCMSILLGRMLATYIVRHKLTGAEKHTHIMITSLVHYCAFIIGILSALLIIGVNLTSLTVIAGALSFGLGFSLQSFVKDFISGLVIMFNRPIKIGDHIAVGDRVINEGFIKKIGALSTQLHTLSHADVIIPNSEIITKVITNYTFNNNRLSRIKITIGFNEDSDLELSKKLLLDIACQNPGVMKELPNEPIVQFELNELNLWCTINDINSKEKIVSELNFAITKAFKPNDEASLTA